METETPRGIKNNNPLNIRYNARNIWVGKVRGEDKKDKEFEEFFGIRFGYRAAAYLIHTYIRRGENTVEAIVEKWAPLSEKQTGKYIYHVCQRSGLKRDTRIELCKTGDFLRLLDAMAVEENGCTPEKLELVRGYFLALACFHVIIPYNIFAALNYLECSGVIKINEDK